MKNKISLAPLAAAFFLAASPALATTFSDTITGAQTFNVASSPLGGVGGCGMQTGAHAYASRPLTTNNSTTYTFTVTSVTGVDDDPFLALYAGTFDPANPTANLVGCNDDAIGLLSQFSSNLTAGTAYTVVSTTYGAGVITGTVNYDVTPDVTLAGAPVLSAVGVGAVATTTATLSGTSSKAGTGYWVVALRGGAVPNAANVRAGTAAGLVAAGSGAMGAGSPASFSLSGLTAATNYTAYLMAEDAQPLQSVVTGVDFRTAGVVLIDQAIVFGAAPSLVYGGTGTASATGGGSGNPVVLTSLTGSTCSVAGTTVGALAAGTCTLAANQAGNASYNAAPQVTQSIAVAKASQSIGFGAAPVVPVGGTGTVSATGGGSGNAVTFSSLTAGTCTVAGGTVTAVAAGACTVAADQAGNANFDPAPQALLAFTVSRLPQAIAFGPAPLLAAGGTATVSASGGASGNAVVFASLTPDTCSISGATLSGRAVGSCTIAANQAGDATYLDAPQATLAIAVFQPTPNRTALWWNPDEPGWGINVNHQGEIVFATLFTYASDGAPLWLVASDMRLQGDGSFLGTLYRTSGPRFDQQPWPFFGIVMVGEIRLRFTAADRGEVSWTFVENTPSALSAVHRSATKSIQPQVFRAEVPTCFSSTGSRAAEGNHQDLWWNPQEPGWGLNLAQQGDTIFATLFTYDDAGRDLWLVASGLERQPDGGFAGELYRTAAPGFEANGWKGYSLAAVGSLRMDFTDGENARLAYTVNGRSVVKQVTRQVYGLTVPVCRD